MAAVTTPMTVEEFRHGAAKLFASDQPVTDPNVLPGFAIPTSAIFEGV